MAYFNGSEPLHITAPYNFALKKHAAATSTAAIVNPSTREYVGQTLFDFFPSAVATSLDSVVDGFSFVITLDTKETADGSRSPADGDVVVGPMKGEYWEQAWIEDVLFTANDTTNKDFFRAKVLPGLKSGAANYAEFTRLEIAGELDKLGFAYVNVTARVLEPIDPSDYSRGVNATNIASYMVAIGMSYTNETREWQGVADEVDGDLRALSIAYASTVVTVSVVLLFVTYKVRSPCKRC